MADRYPVVKVAAVQAASLFLDRDGSTEKAFRLIGEADPNGVRIIAFPKGFMPVHPVWYHHHAATSAITHQVAVELFKNAVEVPGREIEVLAAAARNARVSDESVTRSRRLWERDVQSRTDPVQVIACRQRISPTHYAIRRSPNSGMTE